MDANQEPTTTSTWPDWRWLALLLVLVIPLRAFMIYNTEVISRDSIGYIRYALEFEKTPWDEVLRNNHQHPGYAFSVWAVSVPVRYMFGLNARSMQLSAQITSSIAAVLLIFPMFFFGKLFFGHVAAFWGGLFFQTLPISGHLLADGLSEALFFLLCITSLYFAARALQQNSYRAYVFCGVFGGLAYWTRPEGLLIPAVAGLALLLRQVLTRRPIASRRFLMQSICIVVPVVVVGSPYVLTTGSLSNKPSLQIVMGRLQAFAVEPELRDRHQIDRAGLFGAQMGGDGGFVSRFGVVVVKLLSELAQAFHYGGWVPALFGLWWHRRRLCKMSAFWLASLFCLAQTALVLVVGLKAGYVSYRHITIIVLFGSVCAGGGVYGLAVSWSRWRIRQGKSLPWRSATGLTALIMLILIVCCLPKTLQPLHRNRAGHHAAGKWLATRVQDGDVVEDDHFWAHYYAGLVFREGEKTTSATRQSAKRYIVMTRSSRRVINEIRRKQETLLQSQNGRIVFHWPPHRTPETARLVIYALPALIQ